MKSNSKQIIYLSPKDIVIPANCKRKNSDMVAESVFARGVKRTGIHEPFLVFKSGGEYRLVDGARRLKFAIDSDVDKVPCVVDEGYDASYGNEARYRNYLRFVVNYHRQDLPRSQKIYFINMAIKKYGMKLSDIADALGMKEESLRHQLELNDANASIKDLVDNNIISISSVPRLKKLNSTGLNKLLSQVDTTSRVPDKTVAYLSGQLDPEIHFKDPGAARQIKTSIQQRKTRIPKLKALNDVPSITKSVFLDDYNVQEEKVKQLGEQIRSFTQDFVLVYPVIKSVLANKEICAHIDRNILDGFQKFIRHQDADDAN